MPSQAIGIVKIVWLGQSLDVEKGAKITPGGNMPTVIDTAAGSVIANSFKSGKVTATVPLKKGQSLLALRNGGNPGELQFNTDTGQQWIDAAAVVTNQPSATGGEGGKVDLEWTIGEPIELLSA